MITPYQWQFFHWFSCFGMATNTYPAATLCWYEDTAHKTPPWACCKVTSWQLRSWNRGICVNSLDPERSGYDAENSILNLVLLVGSFRSSYDNILRWMPGNLVVDQSTLAQVMAWCHEATSHYLSQCLPRSMSPYGTTRPQWVNSGLCKCLCKFTTWNGTVLRNMVYKFYLF